MLKHRSLGLPRTWEATATEEREEGRSGLTGGHLAFEAAGREAVRSRWSHQAPAPPEAAVTASGATAGPARPRGVRSEARPGTEVPLGRPKQVSNDLKPGVNPCVPARSACRKQSKSSPKDDAVTPGFHNYAKECLAVSRTVPGDGAKGKMTETDSADPGPGLLRERPSDGRLIGSVR